ncbi:7280_t:CDS:2 [Cetraspora pellucida]|uniref:7280_t:CDS:1 n=1 Tax=Cetraspora pellucida TaxID=1433469 RepID=A0ACA9PNV4_9GLOM|nr:7280_t:CDS:2 [Cetraspora pellucida]
MTDMSLDEISDSNSLTGYDITNNQDQDTPSQRISYSSANSHDITTANQCNVPTSKLYNDSQKLKFSDEESLINWLCTRPDLIAQAQSLLKTSSDKTEVSILEQFDKETITNLVIEQCKLLFLRTQNPTKKIRETLIKKITPSMDFISREFKMLNKKTCEYFDNFRHTFNKDMAALAKDLLVKHCDPTDENIEQFVAGRVWRQKLIKYLEASDYSEFKKSLSSLKSLENFVGESLKIHVDHLIAASGRNYVNELDLDLDNTELFSDE